MYAYDTDIAHKQLDEINGFLSFSKKHLTDLYIKAWNTRFSQNTIGWFVRKTRHQKKERKNPIKIILELNVEL